MEYYIFVSNDCNLNCSYCSVIIRAKSYNIPKEPTYSLEELNHFIDITQKELNDNVADIIFFGGEPTLNFPFIEKLIKSQKERKDASYTYRYMLHTNGILLSNIPNSILKNLNSILLSINYDKVPHMQLNNSYFKVIVDAVHNIKQRYPIPIVARLTITEKTSLYSEIALFNPFFDAVYWQIENKYHFDDFSTFNNSYKYELNLIFNLWLSYLKRGTLLRFIPFLASTYFATNKHTTNTFCCGYNSSMVYIQTNGHCYTCAEDMITEKNLIGEIMNGIEFDTFSPNDTVCKSCAYLQMCMGRCGRMHREFDSNHVKEYCELNHILFNLVNEHLCEIQNYCDKYGINISLADPIYHYTEYTP